MKSHELVNLAKLFDKRLFNIPKYQRDYRWQTAHRKALFSDIAERYDKEHFMATIIGLRDGEQKIGLDTYEKIDIVDGQQRITTLIILCKEISKKLNNKFCRQIQEILVKSDETTTLLLQSNHNTKNYFKDYIMSDQPNRAETTTETNMYNAAKECEEFINEWEKTRDVSDLYNYVMYKIRFVYYEIEDVSSVYSVFGILNSRGLPVSDFDRLKSVLMNHVVAQGNSKGILDDIHNRWSVLFSNMGKLPIDEDVLCFAATLCEPYNKKIRSSGKSIDYFNDEIKKVNPGPFAMEIVNWLIAITKSIVKVRNYKHEFKIYSNNRQAMLVAVAIHTRGDLEDVDKEELIKLCAKLTFGIYDIGEIDARKSVNKYVDLAHRIAVHSKHNPTSKPNNAQINKDTIKESLLEIFGEYSDKINEEIDKISKEDCYTSWKPQLRYLLYKYEEYLTNEAGQKIDNKQWTQIWNETPEKTIEHILPKSENKNYVHYLGNMFLLPASLNSNLGRTNPKNKKQKYSSTGFIMANDIINRLDNWDEQAVTDRSDKIANWMRKEWNMSLSRNSTHAILQKGT